MQPEVTNSFFDFISHKHISAILLALVCFLEIRKGFLKPFGKYAKSLSLKPFLTLAVIAFAGAFIFLPFDSVLIQQVQGLQNPVLDQLILAGAFFGKNYGTWGPLAVLYLIALFVRSEKWGEIFFGGIVASGLTGLLAHILKFIFMRARPFNDLGPFHFFDFHGLMNNNRAFQSFPSGDVAIAAGGAIFLFFALRRYAARWILLLIPFLTALSRMDLNKHWPSDTAFSFLISFMVGKFVLDYLEFKRKENASR